MRELETRDFVHWREEARRLLLAGAAPEEVHFRDAQDAQAPLLPQTDGFPPVNGPSQNHTSMPPPSVTVPRDFLNVASAASRFRDPSRWDLLYRVLYRLTHGERHLLQLDIDDDVRRLRHMETSVRHDIHKMEAFVRFRQMESAKGLEYIAWYKPDHYIVSAAAPFFVRRFGSMCWAILTPDQSAYWDGSKLRLGPGAPRAAAPDADALEDLWRTYYSSTFNPARLNLRLMRAEMPARHLDTLPEAQTLPDLLHSADSRVAAMIQEQPPSAKPWITDSSTLLELSTAAAGCQGCELYRHATATVFGRGPQDARVVLVGEQPGDQEDLAGQPFVGPAGQLLDKALMEAGLDRSQLYVTNAVKHFKFEERGKRRIHAKPSGIEISACRPWLEAELRLIRPALILCLGATAAQSLMGRDFRITRDRGKLFPTRWARHLIATIHPSAILRMPEPGRAAQEYRLLVEDLALIPPLLATST